MKTAISLPDDLFQAAERYAQDQGLSRSELYAQALTFFLQAHRYEGTTQALDIVYATEQSALDPALRSAQTRTLMKDEW